MESDTIRNSKPPPPVDGGKQVVVKKVSVSVTLVPVTYSVDDEFAEEEYVTEGIPVVVALPVACVENALKS
ncbi:MAG TPA: hypothetical protein VLY65_00515 [Nitrososphaerales archaeon]|nr:hypothetical protein [Nitrososphaerales archaeon]